VYLSCFFGVPHFGVSRDRRAAPTQEQLSVGLACPIVIVPVEVSGCLTLTSTFV
jgi:hypothetical protein